VPLFLVGSGEWGVGSRESGVGSRESGVGSREWGVVHPVKVWDEMQWDFRSAGILPAI
jgi:hypothetical protein